MHKHFQSKEKRGSNVTQRASRNSRHLPSAPRLMRSSNHQRCACWCLALCIWQAGVLSAAAGTVNPCRELSAIRKGESFALGLVYWPGGTEADWGAADTGLQPCNPEVQANLTARGAMFATFNARVDRLTVLRTSFAEELILTSRAAPNSQMLISVVAFRANVRSDAKYIASFEPSITKGTGFVPQMSLLAKFDLGVLKYLQFYNLTCNDCGGRTSARCLNDTSCAMAFSECSCATTSSSSSSSNGSSASPSPSPVPSPSPAAPGRHLLQDSPAPADGTNSTNDTSPLLGLNETQLAGQSVCNYANFSFCATGVNLAFQGVDANSAAFTTAAQVKKLTSYSLLSVYFAAKQAFFNVKEMYADKTGEYWGKFGAVQQDIQQAYSGNAAAATDQASSGMI